MSKIATFASLVLLAALAPRPAHACSPPAPGVYGTVPTSGGTHPANAPVLLSGWNISVDQLTATIDGVDAKVEQATTLATAAPGGGPGPGTSPRALQLNPAPKPGQKVEIKGEACGGGPSCQVALSFTAADDDTTPPGAVSAVSFDIFDYLDFKSSGGDCQSNSDLAAYARITAQDGPAETPAYWLVDGYDAATGKQLLFSGVYARKAPSEDLTLRLSSAALGGAPLPSAFCVEITSFDLAGNKAAPVRQCSPCRFRKESGDKPGFSPPEEPTWTGADVVAGGSCDPGGQGGSGGAGGSGGSGQAGAGQAGSGQAGSGQAGSGGNAGSGNPAIAPAESGDDGGCSAGPRPGAGQASVAALLGLLALGRRRRR